MKDLSIKKLYYSISEVSKITGLEQYVLRYWENEFEQLKPQKNRAGNRIYTNKDIQLILLVKKLLRDEKYTIDGAKQILATYNPDEGEKLFEDQIGNIQAGEETIRKTSDSNLLNDLRDVKELLQDIYIKL